MADELIPPEAKAMVGTILQTRSGVVYQKEFQRFAAAVNDLNPIYFDEEAAKAQGYKTTPAPLLFLTQALQGVTRLDELVKDGVPGGGGGTQVPLNVHRKMAGGEEYDFIEPVYPGDTITAESKLASVEEKTGLSGAFVLVTRETTYTNQDGVIVARSRMSMIAR